MVPEELLPPQLHPHPPLSAKNDTLRLRSGAAGEARPRGSGGGGGGLEGGGGG